MNYELAKKLKDAGFIQKRKGKFIKNSKCVHIAHDLGSRENTCFCETYIPTLSELIEACGNKFIKVETNTYALLDPVRGLLPWHALGWKPEEEYKICEYCHGFEKHKWHCRHKKEPLTTKKMSFGDTGDIYGNTPEEAVANLWLKLKEYA